MVPDAFETGRFVASARSVLRHNHNIILYDQDTRRDVNVTLPNPGGFDPPQDDPEFAAPVRDAAEALTAHLSKAPPDTVGIDVDETGRVVSFNTDPKQDATRGTDYLLLDAHELPRLVAEKTVLRSELTETCRIGVGVDVVSYPPSLFVSRRRQHENRFVFKYSTSTVTSMWTEIQMLARLPRHPNIVLLDRLVLDETTKSRVVGFTMRCLPNGTFAHNRRPLKLRWLKQLMQVVDDLNVKYGIIHQDIADRNLMIDPDTDSIVLIDFNVSYRVGLAKAGDRDMEGKWKERDDVKGVLVFLYEYITRDPALTCEGPYQLDLLDEKDFRDPAKWIKHPDVELDDDVAEFYFEVMAWVRRRRAGTQLTHYTEAPEHIEWPDLQGVIKGKPMQFIVGLRRTLGLPYLDWKRPSSSNLDPTRRLLATGRYADEEAAGQKAAAFAGAAADADAAGPPILPWRDAEPGELAPIIPWSPGQVFVPVVPPKAVDAKAGRSAVCRGQKRKGGGAEVSRGVQRPQPKRTEESGFEVGGRVLRPRPTGKRKEAGGNAGPLIAADKPAKKQRASKRSGAALLSARA